MRKILTACLWFVAVAYPLASLRADDPAEALPLLTVSANRFGPTFELVTLDIQGENAKLELPIRGEATDPCWSPDGRKLVYRTGRNGPLQVWKPQPGAAVR
ncbi:MAG TPA: hypothetical protein VND64_06830 [Pirellulales bacterium]|nr:hypothetical protein [Pirellulales bacterium]